MTNAHANVIRVALGGKERNIKLGPAAFRIAKKLDKLDGDLLEESGFGIDSLCHLIFVGLLVDEPELSEITVMQWLADSGKEYELIPQITEQLNKVAELMGANVNGKAVEGNAEEKKDYRSLTLTESISNLPPGTA